MTDLSRDSLLLEPGKPLTPPPRWTWKTIEFRRMLLLALPIGILAGLAVSALEWLCDSAMWGNIARLPLSLKLAAPVIGLVASGWALHRLHNRGIGMSNDLVVHDQHLSGPSALEEDALKLGACLATVGMGASVGLGSPSQWLGASLGLYVRRVARGIRYFRGLLPVHALLIGTAAGVGAYFEPPWQARFGRWKPPSARSWMARCSYLRRSQHFSLNGFMD